MHFSGSFTLSRGYWNMVYMYVYADTWCGIYGLAWHGARRSENPKSEFLFLTLA